MPYRTLAGLFKKEQSVDKIELIVQKILSCPINPNEYYYTTLGITSRYCYQLKTLDVSITTSGQLFCAVNSRHPIFILKDRRLKKFAKKMKKDHILRLKERLKRDIELDRHETKIRKEKEALAKEEALNFLLRRALDV